jgi:Na+/H+ antiporter NhaD and related arsenite permeases
LLIQAVILLLALFVFAVGKSPLFRVDRAGAAIIGASLTIATGVIGFDQAAQAVDYRTIVLLFSMMIMASYLNLSGFFQLAGNLFLNRLRTKKQLLIMVIITSGIFSAFFINDIVCLLFTPIIIIICRKVNLNPVPYLLGVATSSNIGSAATLIGNPQNILIGSLSRIHFAWYMAVATPLTLVGLVLTYYTIAHVYEMELRGPLLETSPLTGAVHGYLIKKGITVVILVLAGFLIGFDPAIVASLGAAFLLLTRRIKPNKVYAGIDFNLIVIFIGLFVIIGGVEQSGLLTFLLNSPILRNIQSLPVFSVITVLLSNVVSNVPAVMLLKFLIPTGTGIWWAAMAVFSTFAGNLTLTGSIANLIVVELAKKQNVEISFSTYLKIGLPLTVCMVTIALAYFTILMKVFL